MSFHRPLDMIDEAMTSSSTHQQLKPRLRLKGVPKPFWGQARKALANSNVLGFFSSAPSDVSMYLLLRNWDWFAIRGLAEKALIEAWSNQKRTYAYSPHMPRLLDMVDRTRLLAAGDPLPEGETFILYRGVSGDGDPYGASWTINLEVARFFASIPHWGSGTIYAITVPRSDIYAYLHDCGRTESEALLRLSGDETLAVVEQPVLKLDT